MNIFKEFKDKINERVLAKIFIFYLIVLIVVGLLLSKIPHSLGRDPILSTFGVIMLFLFVLIIIMAYMVAIKQIKEMHKKEPLTLFTMLLAVVFVSFPILLNFFGTQNVSSELVKSFYSIAVGIGVNYVIDSVFKFVEPEFTASKKNLLTKKAAFTKILFNVLYISEYLSFIIVEYSKKVCYRGNDIKILKAMIDFYSEIYDWGKIVIFTVILFVIIMIVSLYSIGIIKREVESETPDDLEIISQKLTNEIEQVDQLLETLRDDDLISNLDIIKSKLNSELEKLNELNDK